MNFSEEYSRFSWLSIGEVWATCRKCFRLRNGSLLLTHRSVTGCGQSRVPGPTAGRRG